MEGVGAILPGPRVEVEVGVTRKVCRGRGRGGSWGRGGAGACARGRRVHGLELVLAELEERGEGARA